MKLLLFLSAVRPGGAERVMTTLANEFCKRGYEVILATLDTDEKDFYQLDPRIRRERLSLKAVSGSVHRAVMNNAKKISRMRNLLYAESPDAVLSFTNRINVPVLLASLGTGIPIIVSERIDPRMTKANAAYKTLRRLLYPKAAAVVAQTKTERTWFSRFVKTVVLIPNPVSIQSDSIYRLQQQREKTISGMGRLERQKGFDLLIDAFHSLHPKFPEWSLQIYGKGSQQSALSARIVALGPDSGIMLMGITITPFEVFSRTGIFVLSSRYEGFPNVLIEAMSTGAPCIAFDCPSGPADILEDGKSGLLVNEISSTALAKALEKALSDEEERTSMGSFAAERIKHYSLKTIVDSWETLLRSLPGFPL